MKVSTNIQINGRKEEVWAVISDIENAVNNIEGIVKVEILNPPGQNLVGLKWKETRIMYGKEAIETMWVTHGLENEFYQTRAESHGAIYISHFTISEKDGISTLTMSFEGRAVTPLAKFFNLIFANMMKKSLASDMHKDLEDIKKVVEANK